VLGSKRTQLINQFIMESLLITLLSIILAVIITASLLPEFNSLLGKDIQLNLFSDIQLPGFLVIIWILTGFVSGLYPAFFLSKFQPVKVLKGKFSNTTAFASFRKALVIFQFSISTILIIVTIVVNSQLNYIQQKDPGYNKEQVVVIPFASNWVRNHLSSIKSRLLSNKDIAGVSAGSGKIGMTITFTVSGIYEEGSDESEFSYSISNGGVDHDFIKMMDIDIIRGRDFNENFATDTAEAFLINKAAEKMLGGNVIGRTFIVRNPLGEPRKGKIVGVFKDIIHASLHQKIEPLLFHSDSRSFNYIYIKLNPGQIPAALSFLEERWREWLPEHPLEYQFLDENFGLLYAEEQKLGNILNSFSLFAIFVACLGLWGLTSFSFEQKRKEVSIRKVLGATSYSIIATVLKDYFIFITIAFLISIPFAWYITDTWLSDFAYKISLNPLYYATGGLIVLVVSIVTVLYHVTLSVKANPVSGLRME